MPLLPLSQSNDLHNPENSDTTAYFNVQNKMPANSKIDSVLAAIKQQKIPILGVKIANKVILPGTFIAKGGK